LNKGGSSKAMENEDRDAARFRVGSILRKLDIKWLLIEVDNPM